MKFLTIPLAVLAAALPLGAMEIGANLDFVTASSTQLMYADLIKTGTGWVPYDATKGGGPGTRGVETPLTAQGWPREVPFTPEGGTPQRVYSVIQQNTNGTYPAGDYRFRVKGTGVLRLRGSGLSEQIAVRGRHEGTLTLTPDSGGLLVHIDESSAEDPIRDLQLILPGHDFDDLFNREFVAAVRDYKVLRFLNPLKVNNSPIVEWTDGAPIAYHRYSDDNGVPPEHLVALANETAADVWVNLPHAASDAYVRRFATLLRDQLAPGKKVYVEWSNEVWNGMFKAGGHAEKQGEELGLGKGWDAKVRYQARRSGEVWRIFADVFGDQRTRLVNVIASQAANSGVTGQLVKAVADPTINPSGMKADALAVAPYFGRPIETDDLAGGLPTVEWLTELARSDIRQKIPGWLAHHRKHAAAHGLRLLAYEAGQHFVGLREAAEKPELVARLVAFNRDPVMEPLYREYLDMLAANGFDLVCIYKTYANPWLAGGKWGTWGLQEYTGQPLEQAPKLRGLRAWQAARKATSSVPAPPLGEFTLGAAR